MKKTNVFLNSFELADLRDSWEKALKTPVVLIRSDLPDLASTARRLVQDKINELAKEKGLPDIKENYNVDGETGELFDPSEEK